MSGPTRGLDRLVLPADARIEVIATGFEWSEGPVWVKDGGYLLFSDIPRNSVMKWTRRMAPPCS